MKSNHWKISDLPWDKFEPAKLDPELLKIVKAASLVEYGGNKYAQYLHDVFSEDSEFQKDLKDWGNEEVQHGEALGLYAERADPSFNLQHAFARYHAGYKFDFVTGESVRGSHSGELLARCIVETGTSSYYTAIADKTDEPLLKAISRTIAADELRHYKLFYVYLKKYLDQEQLSRFQRLRIGLGRMQESEDDELAYAYYAANALPDAIYNQHHYTMEYMARAYKFYRPEHVERMVAMVFKVCGLKPHTLWHGIASRAAWFVMNKKAKNAMKVAA